MKSNQFEFHEHELSKKNKPINNQRQKPQTHDSKQKKLKEKDRKEKEKKLPRNRRGGFLCEGDEGEGGFWRGRPGTGREGVV